MLTADLVRPRLKARGSALHIDLLDPRHAHWQRSAAELIDLFGQHLHHPRHAWDEALELYEADRLDYNTLRGLAKVLCDAATFTPIETTLPPDELRDMLFMQGPAFDRRDLFRQQTRRDILRDAAKKLRSSQKALEAALFADRPAEYLLTELGMDWTPDALINRYNLELARGALYFAHTMTIDIHDTYKDFWRYLKLFKLMFWGEALAGGGYRVTIDGPISPFVVATRRYGRQMAAFLPALFLCERWRMVAEVRFERADLLYQLDAAAPLRTHFKASAAYDSRLEADFAAEFHGKFGDERAKWRLQREDEVLLLGDMVMIPDFSLTHTQDGRRALLEIMGFWHPDYLRRKLEKVRAAGRRDLILLVYEGVNLTPEALADVPAQVLYFKNKPVLKDVLALVEQVAV